MLFTAFTVFSALVLIIIPLSAWLYFAKKWKLGKMLFWKAGLSALIIEIFYLTVLGNAGSILPQYIADSPLPMALLVALSAGLFMELGRFLVLDKVFKKMRTFREGLYFALGWGGVETILIGFFLLISIMGMQVLVHTDNIAVYFPDASSQEIAQMKEVQVKSGELINGNPLVALSPLAERGARMALDLSLTVLVLLSLATGLTKYTWGAVALRTLITFVVVYAGAFSQLAGDFIFVALAAFSLSIIRQFKKEYPKYLR